MSADGGERTAVSFVGRDEIATRLTSASVFAWRDQAEFLVLFEQFTRLLHC